MALVTLTQGHLRMLDLCPRRFQYAYLDQLAAPTAPAMLERQQWGTRFHLVMQQRELGLATAALLAQNPDLATAVQALLTAAPDLFPPPPSSINPEAAELFLRQSEHRRSVALEGYELTVVYDLLILTPTDGHIIDWKTYRQPPSAEELAQDWQTRLYCYVLAATTDLAPSQITMSYWFVPPAPARGTPPQPSQIAIPYSVTEHRRTERDLRHRIKTLTRLLAQAQDLPKVDAAKGHCGQCPFAIRCQRSEAGYDVLMAAIPAIDEIAEVPL